MSTTKCRSLLYSGLKLKALTTTKGSRSKASKVPKFEGLERSRVCGWRRRWFAGLWVDGSFNLLNYHDSTQRRHLCQKSQKAGAKLHTILAHASMVLGHTWRMESLFCILPLTRQHQLLRPACTSLGRPKKGLINSLCPGVADTKTSNSPL